MEDPRPFAAHGSEKMIYDVRMGPQCLCRDGTFWVAYLANPDGDKALPHIIRRDLHGTWLDPVVLGDVACYDHHFAPVLWFDAAEHIHVLYHCHSGLDEARHLVSAAPLDCARWTDAPPIAPSISYPRLLRCPDSELVLYYRALGHMWISIFSRKRPAMSGQAATIAWPWRATEDRCTLPLFTGTRETGHIHSTAGRSAI